MLFFIGVGLQKIRVLERSPVFKIDIKVHSQSGQFFSAAINC